MTYITSDEFHAIITPATVRISKLFEQAGFDIRIVGGAVRDSLLRVMPKDVDFATNATPEEMIRLMVAADLYVIGVTESLRRGKTLDEVIARIDNIPGIQHGTVSAVINGETFEITTLRYDMETTGRHAKVAFHRSFPEDAKRRDFRFNAMYASMDGELHDYVGGKDDLDQQVVRFVGAPSQRIREDYLRILRYFRFAARLGFSFDDAADAAIAYNVAGLTTISGERIWAEMSKLFMYRDPVKYLLHMHALGVTEAIQLPVDMDQVRVVSEFATSPVSVLAASLRSVSEVDTLAARWKLSGVERNLAAFLVQYRDDRVGLRTAQDMVVDGANHDFVAELLRVGGRVAEADTLVGWVTPKFPVSGADLMALGMKQGKELGDALKSMKERWKRSDFQLSKDELMAGGV
jgi:hypothetical protein